jgi:hypothetical protein
MNPSIMSVKASGTVLLLLTLFKYVIAYTRTVRLHILEFFDKAQKVMDGEKYLLLQSVVNEPIDKHYCTAKMFKKAE